jgi:hypothetical protein
MMSGIPRIFGFGWKRLENVGKDSVSRIASEANGYHG